jgi:hypothetical protein
MQRTIRIRILTEGMFVKLVDKITKQYKLRHGFDATTDQVCEDIALAVEEKKLFG